MVLAAVNPRNSSLFYVSVWIVKSEKICASTKKVCDAHALLSLALDLDDAIAEWSPIFAV